jgi:hypothetical protein
MTPSCLIDFHVGDFDGVNFQREYLALAAAEAHRSARSA